MNSLPSSGSFTRVDDCLETLLNSTFTYTYPTIRRSMCKVTPAAS